MGLASIKRYAITIEGQTALISAANELAVALFTAQGRLHRVALDVL